jgi:hypothetical protein
LEDSMVMRIQKTMKNRMLRANLDLLFIELYHKKLYLLQI